MPDKFKQYFKYYKSKNPPPDLSNVLDFNVKQSIIGKVRPINLFARNEEEICSGLKPLTKWEVYEIIDRPGLIFIRNPFTNLSQRYWTVRCLKDYPKKPNKTNLDIHNILNKGNLWDVYQDTKNKNLLNKLRWVTLGYHHNWDTKVYTEDQKSQFPIDLDILSQFIAKTLGYSSFKPEAAIVNFYNRDSSLSGHVDYSEQNLDAPLISISFGQTAIFLLGGKTTDIIPTAMFIRTGDIIIMSKESRLCYHAVPKILQVDSRVWEKFDENGIDLSSKDKSKDIIDICLNEDLWRPFGDYLETSRININIRQVLNQDQGMLYAYSVHDR